MIPAATLEMPDGYRVQTPPLDEGVLTVGDVGNLDIALPKAVVMQKQDDHTSVEATYDQVRIERSIQSSDGDHARYRIKTITIESLLI